MNKEIAQKLVDEHFPGKNFKVVDLPPHPYLKPEVIGPSIKEIKEKMGITIESPFYEDSPEDSGIVNISNGGISKAVVISKGKIIGLQG